MKNFEIAIKWNSDNEIEIFQTKFNNFVEAENWCFFYTNGIGRYDIKEM